MKKDTAKYKISPKGKRKLDFPNKARSSVKLPLVGKTIYLDVKELKHLKRLQADLKKLGGTLEEFVSKDINYLITSQPRPKSRRADGGHGPDLSPAPSPFSYDPSPSPGNLEDKKVATVTRGKALAEKARIRSKSNTLLDNAERWGVKIVSLEGAYKWIEKEIKKLPRSSQLNGKVSQKTKCVTNFTTFKSPFVKFESTSHGYRPLHSQLDTWPRLNVDTPRGSCPFDGTLIARGDQSHEERGELMAAQVDIFTPDTPREEKDRLGSVGDTRGVAAPDKSQKKSDTDIFEGSAVLTAGDMKRRREQKRRQERKRGYCECCLVKYEDLDKHVCDDKHRAYVRDKSNFLDLDVVIRCVPSTADFVAKYFMYSLAEKSREKTISESQSEELDLIPVTPAKMETKITSPRCTRKPAKKSEETDQKENTFVREKDETVPQVFKESPYVDKKCEVNEVPSKPRRSTRTSAPPCKQLDAEESVVDTQETNLGSKPVEMTTIRSNKERMLTCLSPSKASVGRQAASAGVPEERTRSKKGECLLLTSPRKTNDTENTAHTRAGLTIMSPHKASKDNEHARTRNVSPLKANKDTVNAARARINSECPVLSSPHKTNNDTENIGRTTAGLTVLSPYKTSKGNGCARTRNTLPHNETNKDTARTRSTSVGLTLSPRKSSKNGDTDRTRHTRAGVTFSSPRNKNKENQESLSQPKVETANELTCSPKVLRNRNSADGVNIANDSDSGTKSSAADNFVPFSVSLSFANDSDTENGTKLSAAASSISPRRTTARRNLVGVISPTKTHLTRSPRKRVRANDENKELQSPSRESTSHSLLSGDGQNKTVSPRSKSAKFETTCSRLSKIHLRRLSLSPENGKKIHSEKDVVLESNSSDTNSRSTRNTASSTGRIASRDDCNSVQTVNVSNATHRIRRSPRKQPSQTGSHHPETYINDFVIANDSTSDNATAMGSDKKQSSTSITAAGDKMLDTNTIASHSSPNILVAATSKINLEPLISTGQAAVGNKRSSDDFEKCILVAMTTGELPVDQDRIENQPPAEEPCNTKNPVIKQTNHKDSVEVESGCMAPDENDTVDKFLARRKLRNRNSNIIDMDEGSEKVESAVVETRVSKRSLRNSCLVENEPAAASQKSPLKSACKSPLKNIVKLHTVCTKSPSKLSLSGKECSRTSLQSMCRTIVTENEHSEQVKLSKVNTKTNPVNKDSKKSKSVKPTFTASDYLIPSDPASIPSDMAYLLEDESIIFTKSLAERVKERQAGRRPSVESYNLNVLGQSPLRSRSNSFSSTKSDSSTSRRTDKTLNAVGGKLKQLIISVMPEQMKVTNVVNKKKSRRKEKLAKTVMSKAIHASGFKTNSESSVDDAMYDQDSSKETQWKSCGRLEHEKDTRQTLILADKSDTCDNENGRRQTRNMAANADNSYKAISSSRNKESHGFTTHNKDTDSENTARWTRSRTEDNRVILGKLKMSDYDEEVFCPSNVSQQNSEGNQSSVLADSDIEMKKETVHDKDKTRQRRKVLLKKELNRLKEKYLKKNQSIRPKKRYNANLKPSCNNVCPEIKVKNYVESDASIDNGDIPCIVQTDAEHTNASTESNKRISNVQNGLLKLNMPLNKDVSQYSSTESLNSECSTGRQAVVQLRRCKTVLGARSHASTHDLKETKTLIAEEMKKRDNTYGNEDGQYVEDSVLTVECSLSVSKPFTRSSPAKQIVHGRPCTQMDELDISSKAVDNCFIAKTNNLNLKCKPDRSDARVSARCLGRVSMSPRRKRKFVKDSDGEDTRSTSPIFTSSKSPQTFRVKPLNSGGRRSSPVFQKSPLSKRLKEHRGKLANKMDDNLNTELPGKVNVPSCEVGVLLSQVSVCSLHEKQHKGGRVRISRSTREGVGKTTVTSMSSKNTQENNEHKHVDNVVASSSRPVAGRQDGQEQSTITDTVNHIDTMKTSDDSTCSSPPATPRRKMKISSPKSGYSSTPRENRRRKWKRKPNEASSQGDSEVSESSSGHSRKRRKLEKLKYDVSMNETGEISNCGKIPARSKLNMDDKTEKVGVKLDHVNKVDEVNQDELNHTIKENDECNETDTCKEVVNSSFTLKWDPVLKENPSKQVVKLNKSWSLLSERSMAKLLSSDDDRDSFDGFTKHELSADSSLPSDLSYEEKEQVEFDKSSEHEWIIEVENIDEDATEDLDKDEFDHLLPAKFSSPAKRSDSSWNEALDSYINKSLKESENTSGKELNASLTFSSTCVRRSPRKNTSFSVDAGKDKTGLASPRQSRGTTPKKKRDKDVGDGVFDRETVDQEIEFNYRSPQKYRNEFSPLRVCNGEIISVTAAVSGKILTSTPSRTRRCLEGKKSSKGQSSDPLSKSLTFLSVDDGDIQCSDTMKPEKEKRLLKKVSNTKKTFSLEYEKMELKKKGKSKKHK